MKRLVAAVLAVALVLTCEAPAVRASDASDLRCTLLTQQINQHRPDLGIRRLLCDVAHHRAYDMIHKGALWHDLRPVMAALSRAHVCWVNVGEVVAWNNLHGTDRAKAAFFVTQWSRSPSHWAVLMGRRYTRGGGSWMAGFGRNYAAYYVLDLC